MAKQLNIGGDWAISAQGKAALEEKIVSESSQKLELMVAEKGEDSVTIPSKWKNKVLQPNYVNVSSRRDLWDTIYESEIERKEDTVFGKFLETGTGKQIAVVKIDGAIVYECGIYQEFWYDICCMKRISKLLDELRQNSNVIGVILLVNSPGGDVAATSLGLKHLRLLREVKPVWSIVEMATSGAQLIVAETDRIICETEAVTVGSLGVYTRLLDKSGWEEMSGRKTVFITARKSVRKLDYRSDQPPSEDALEAITSRMDEILEWMISIIVRNRGIDEGSEVFDADIYRAERGLELGLIDEIAETDALEIAIKGLLGGLRDYVPPSQRTDNASLPNKNTTSIKNISDMAKSKIEFKNLPEAREEGVSSEVIVYGSGLTAREAGALKSSGDYVLVSSEYMSQLDEDFASANAADVSQLEEEMETVLGDNEKILAAHEEVKEELKGSKDANVELQAKLDKATERVGQLEGVITEKLGADALNGGGSDSSDSSLKEKETEKATGLFSGSTRAARIAQIHESMAAQGIK